MAVWSHEAVTSFINIYKSHPCLWKVKSPEYRNRAMRNKAYQELVEYCKKIGFRSANKDFAVKKVQSLRGAFRKELRKIMYSLENAKSEDDAYKPSLFYFDMLMFTKDQDITEDASANEEKDTTSNQDEDITEDASADEEKDTTSNQDEEDSNDGSWTEDVKNIATIDVRPFPDTSTSNTRSIRTSNAISVDGRSFRRDESGPSSSQASCLKRMRSPPRDSLAAISESDAFGIIVSRKLQKMDSLQAVYAETVMLKVLRRGLLGTLTTDTDVCESQCTSFVG